VATSTAEIGLTQTASTRPRSGTSLFTRRWSLTAVSILSPLLLLGIWEVIAFTNWVDTRFFPPPSRVAGVLVNLLSSGQFLSHIALSLGRILAGYSVGVLFGVLIGVAAGISPTFRAVIGPLVTAMYSVPKTALLPLMVLFFGFGEVSKIVVLAISAFFLTLVNTTAGVRSIAPVYFEVARNLRVGKLLLLRTVAIPGALPYIIAGMKLAWGVALLLIVVAEMTATDGGLGFFIMASWRLFKIQDMMAGLIVIGVIGYLSNLLFDQLAARTQAWKA
jgi:ABC-type nitrate/sulfonate/bicarbonate transport system permease component